MRSACNTRILDDLGNDLPEGLLSENLIHIRNLLRHILVDNDAARGSLDHVGALGLILLVDYKPYIDPGVKFDGTLVESHNDFLRAVEALALALCTRFDLGDVVQTEHHILRRYGDRSTVGRVENVLGTEHEKLGLHHGCIAERKMDCHLVTVEVGVERGTCERMKLDGLALDHAWLECLDTEPVKSRSTVQENRMSLHHILEDIPDDRILPVHNLLGRLHGLHDAALNQFPDNERFVKLGCHELRQTALVHLELRTNDNH